MDKRNIMIGLLVLVFFILLSRRKRIMEGWTQKENMICAKNESSGSGKTPGIQMKINSNGILGQGQWQSEGSVDSSIIGNFTKSHEGYDWPENVEACKAICESPTIYTENDNISGDICDSFSVHPFGKGGKRPNRSIPMSICMMHGKDDTDWPGNNRYAKNWRCLEDSQALTDRTTSTAAPQQRTQTFCHDNPCYRGTCLGLRPDQTAGWSARMLESWPTMYNCLCDDGWTGQNCDMQGGTGPWSEDNPLEKCQQPARGVVVGAANAGDWDGTLPKTCANVQDTFWTDRSERCANNCVGCYQSLGGIGHACVNGTGGRTCDIGPQCDPYAPGRSIQEARLVEQRSRRGRTPEQQRQLDAARRHLRNRR